MERPPRILPNGRWWLYLSFVPALLSQTRATWGIYPIFGILDLVHVWRRVVGVGDRRSVVALAIGACVAVAALLPMSGIVMQRADQALVEIDRYEQTGVASGSVDVRMAMWSSAFEIWREHPLIGIGHVGKMETVAERSGVNEAQVGQYTHLHNLIVDEALNSGIVGTLLLVGVFGVFIGTVFVRSRNTMLRETSVVFVVLVFSYGSFHGVLLNEWMVTVIFGYMSVTLTDLRRKQLGARLRAEIGRA
nr:O-antigen ligase family protein [Aureimonas altamirensis]